MKEQAKNDLPDEQVLTRLLKLAGPRLAPSNEVRNEVYDVVREAWEQRSRRKQVLRRLIPVALAASLIGLALVIYWPGYRAPVIATLVADLDRGSLELNEGQSWSLLTNSGTITADSEIRTGSQQRAGIILRNGISVRLDRETLLRIKSPRQMALLGGRIYIDTVEYAGPGIEISAGVAVVRNIGTQFEVRVETGGTLVRVRAGEVSMQAFDEQFSAVRGERLFAQQNGSIERSMVPGHDPSWNWVQSIAPVFDTDGRLVSELVDWVGRETGRRIEYGDSLIRNAAASTYIRGSVSGRTPEETLDLALETTRFKYYINDDVLAIEKHLKTGN